MDCRPLGRLFAFFIVALRCIAYGDTFSSVLTNSYAVVGGQYAYIEFKGSVALCDKSNAHPIGALRVSFSDSHGQSLRTGDCGLYGCGRGDGTMAFEYLYGAPNVTNEEGFVEWRFKVKSPINATVISVDIRPVRPKGPISFGELRVENASGLEICREDNVTDIGIYELPRLGAKWDKSLDVFPGEARVLSGTVLPSEAKPVNTRAGIVLVRFEGRDGVVPVEKGLSHSDKFGNYFYLARGENPIRFVKKFEVPEKATRMHVGAFSFKEKCRLDGRMTVSVVVSEPSTLPTDDFYLGQLNEIVQDTVVPPVKRPVNNSFLPENWKSSDFERDIVAFEHFDGVKVSDDMDWNANPMNSTTWQSNLNAGYWICVMGRGLDSREYYDHCRKYWMSFLRQQGSVKGKYHAAYCEHCCAARIEAILVTLFGLDLGQGEFRKLPALTAALSSEPDFKRKLLMQLARDVQEVSYHLRARTMGIHNHNVLMARALLQFADCFSKYEFSGRYRRLALSVLLDHLDGMFETDGFIREQSVAYHFAFTKYFAAVYDYLRVNNSCDLEVLDSVRKKVTRLVDVCFSIVPPDERTPPMGDAAALDLREGLVGLVALLEGVSGKRAESIVDERFNNLSEFTAYKKSGLYLFRNVKSKKMVMIDLSDVLKVHGHYDLGSWMYYCGTNRWVTDPGGPYQYGSVMHRRLRQSTGHSLMEPLGERQTAGCAYDVQIDQRSGAYVLSYRDNVYAPRFEHERAFIILEDLSAIEVLDSFRCLKGKSEPVTYVNRLVTGVIGSSVVKTGDMSGDIVSPTGETKSFAFSGDVGALKIGLCEISPNYNVLSEVNDITLQIASTNGIAQSVLMIGDRREFPRLAAQKIMRGRADVFNGLP